MWSSLSNQPRHGNLRKRAERTTSQIRKIENIHVERQVSVVGTALQQAFQLAAEAHARRPTG